LLAISQSAINGTVAGVRYAFNAGGDCNAKNAAGTPNMVKNCPLM
jgi:hypothetical protein